MLTGITPVFIDSFDRMENVLSITPYQLQYGGFDRVIVVEFGPQPKLMNLLDPEIDYVYVRGTQWNKSRVVNTALHWVNTEFCAVLDSDVVCPPQQVRGCLELLRTQSASFMCPYDIFHFCARKPGLEIIRNGQELDCHDYANKYSERRYTSGCVGGMMIFRTAFVKYMRGFSELFYGWGHEDSEFAFRANKMGDFMRINGPLIHFNHERTKTSSIGESFDANRSEMVRVQAMSKQEILDYYGISSHEPGYFSKQRAIAEDHLVARAEQLEADNQATE